MRETSFNTSHVGAPWEHTGTGLKTVPAMCASKVAPTLKFLEVTEKQGDEGQKRRAVLAFLVWALSPAASGQLSAGTSIVTLGTKVLGS